MDRKGKLIRKVTRSSDESAHEQKHKRKHTETWDISAITDAFVDQKRVNVCEQAVKWHHVSVYERCHQRVVRQKAGKGEGLEGKLSDDIWG